MIPELLTVEVKTDRKFYNFFQKREYIDVWVISRKRNNMNEYLKVARYSPTSYLFWIPYFPVLLDDKILLNNDYKHYSFVYFLTQKEGYNCVKLIDNQWEIFKKLPIYKLKTKCDEFKIFKKDMYYKFENNKFIVYTSYNPTQQKIKTKEEGLAFIKYENCLLKEKWVDVK